MASIACTLVFDEAEATAWPDGNHAKASSKASTEPTSLTTARVYEPRGQAHGSSSITPSSGEWATSHEARVTGSGFHDKVHCSRASIAHRACYPRRSLRTMRRMVDYVENGTPRRLMAGVCSAAPTDHALQEMIAAVPTAA